MNSFENNSEISPSAMQTLLFFEIRRKGFEDTFNELKLSLCELSLTDPKSYGFLARLVNRLLSDKEGIVVVAETHHVDSTFRDAYYSQYSRRFFDTYRFSIRLSFFDYYLSQGDGKECTAFDELYTPVSWAATDVGDLQNHYLGSCVINPLVDRFIGRTLLRPDRMVSWQPFSQNEAALPNRDAYMRLSSHKLGIAGKLLSVEAFPFHQQDGEVMSCAEVSLLNLMKYYSNCYNMYADIEPFDILNAERRNAYTRVIPTNGLDYNTVSSILYDFGLHPCLYDVDSMKGMGETEELAQRHIKNIMHTYAESGIPTALNVAAPQDAYGGHSLLCIGHGKPDASLEDAALNQALFVDEYTVWTDEDAGDRIIERLPRMFALVDSADLYRDYVVVDDNQLPYSVRPYRSMSEHPTLRNARLIAPLHRGMTKDADKARSQFENIICDPSAGLVSWAGTYLNQVFQHYFESRDLLASDGSFEVVTRMFLASSRTYKSDRVAHIHDAAQASVYACLPMPHFVWVCELYLRDEFFGSAHRHFERPEGVSESEWEKPHAFAEIAMDATVSEPAGELGGAILYNFPSMVAVRMPEDVNNPLDVKLITEDIDWTYRGIPAFSSNLTAVHGC